MKKSKNKCIGVVVKDPNGRNSFNNSFAGLLGAFAKTIPQKPQHHHEALMNRSKKELVQLAKEENAKIWLCWNKTKISNAIIGDE
tara:strand:+ start:39 stop:293 length:255 start_codon:yes stop_codon:yes gene_type:complete